LSCVFLPIPALLRSAPGHPRHRSSAYDHRSTPCIARTGMGNQRHSNYKTVFLEELQQFIDKVKFHGPCALEKVTPFLIAKMIECQEMIEEELEEYDEFQSMDPCEKED